MVRVNNILILIMTFILIGCVTGLVLSLFSQENTNVCHKVVIKTHKDVPASLTTSDYTEVTTTNGDEYNIYNDLHLYDGETICAENLQ